MPSVNRHWPRWLLLWLLMFAVGRAVAAAGNPLDAGMPPFPALTGPVVDGAHLLPAAVFERLSQKLAAYSRENGTQVVVVTVPTLNGYPIDYYGYQLGRHWGIGQKGRNNGVVFLVDAGERQARIEVGYGLEGTLTDAQSFLILHNVVFPRLRKGDYAGGISAGTDAILSVLGGHLQVIRQQQARHRNGTGFLMLVIVFFVLLPLLRAMFGRGRGGGPGGYGGGWLGWLALGMLSGGGFGGGGGGFGGGGGGFGGFSGGGGSFGGGGASGGW